MRLNSLPGARTRALIQAHPAAAPTARAVKKELEFLLHTTALLFPSIIEPDPTEIYLTLTANCNLRCLGCRYGRDFMPGSQLSWEVVKGVLDDCKTMNLRNIRFYGGEPLLHPDLPRMVEHAARLGLHSLLTTNGVLLERKFDELYAAGLRRISVGIYGTEESYTPYVQRRNQYGQIVRGIAHARQRGGQDLILALGWLLMRPTCNLESLHEVWKLAEEFNAPIGVSLIHYSLPYFSEGPDGELQFRPGDKPMIEEVVAEPRSPLGATVRSSGKRRCGRLVPLPRRVHPVIGKRTGTNSSPLRNTGTHLRRTESLPSSWPGARHAVPFLARDIA